ncbi:MAG: hypothetical protein E7665_09100 [Ruminococcaceae bacterium]|nr:hypothetical protein [Oscillospiraceae bacterium]
MKTKRFLSSLLVLVMVLGMMASIAPFTAFAAEEEEEVEAIDYTVVPYKTPEEKLATMSLVYSKYNTDLYYQADNGEVAIVDKKTGQILFTNPFDVGDSEVTTASVSIKEKALSQLLISYTNITSGTSYELNSYADAAVSDQIVMKNVRGGIRVEYTIGETEKRKVVPRRISEERFQTLIMDEIDDTFIRDRMNAFYLPQNLFDPNLTQRSKQEMIQKYPIVEQYPIRVIIADVNDNEINRIEGWLKQFTNYTLQDMLDDHEATGYVLGASSPPVFKMALEYYIDEDGVRITLPARGIQFDSSTYALNSIDILPYFGAGRRNETGYGFIPDGSGAIVEFSDIADKNVTIAAQLYGNDYSFHSESYGTTYGGNMEIWRFPVFGIARKSNYTYKTEVQERVPATDEEGNEMKDGKGNTIYKTVTKVTTEEKEISHGYVAIITEGDSLSRLTYTGGGTVHPYQSVFMRVFPRQQDSYPLNGLTVSGGAAVYTVNCDRKYVGNYTIKVNGLYGDDASYVGMAKKYREYLVNNGTLEAITDKGDIALYLETLGDIDAQDRFLGVPVEVKKPLSTFENAQTILQELKDAGINNMNLKYTGWFNGGLYNTPPTKIKVDKVLGGDDGLTALTQYAASNNIGLYPDMDFLFVKSTDSFDKFNSRKQAVKTIEGRVARQKTYEARTQAYGNRGDVVISTNVITDMWNDISEKYSSFNIGGISLSSMGKYLSSDQNEDAPLNREDSKELTVEFLKNVSEAGNKIVVSGGNAYTLDYADVILDLPLESSNRNYESEQVPFIGIVLHGYKEYAGTAINLAGDYKTNLLRILESGAVPYFVVAYDNTPELKDSDFSYYYSIRYEIWKEDIVATYNELNSVLGKVKNATIENHEFIDYRIVETTYSNGVKFVLNFNNYEVKVGNKTIPALGYIVK